MPRLTRKDVVGLVVLGLTLFTAALHRSARPEIQGGDVAFVGVDVLTATSHDVVPNQVVVVRGGVVEQMGAVDRVAVPDHARTVDPSQAAVLMPGMAEARSILRATPAGEVPTFVDRADWLLLSADPRIHPDALRAPIGMMVSGRWLSPTEVDRLVGEADRGTAGQS